MEALDAVEAELAELRREELAAAQERAALAARVEALHVGLNRKDASAALLAATDQVDGLLGSVAALVSVRGRLRDRGRRRLRRRRRRGRRGRRRRGAGRLRPPEDRGPRPGRPAARRPGAERRRERCRADWPALPDGGALRRRRGRGARRAAPERSQRVLRKVAVVDDLPAAQDLVAALPDLIGGHPGRRRAQRPLRGRRVVGAAEPDRGPGRDRRRRAAADRGQPPLRAAAVRPEPSSRSSSGCRSEAVEVTLARLHESDAAMAALAEQLGQLSSTARSAHGEADRLLQAHRPGRAGPRLATSPGSPTWSTGWSWPRTRRDEVEPDPAERDRLAEAARRGPRRRDGRPARAAHHGGAGPGPGRPGRRAAPGGEARAAGPGQGAGPPGADAPRGARRPPAVHAAAGVPGPAGRAVAGPRRRRAGRGRGGADRGRGRAGRGRGRGAHADARTSSRWSTRRTATRWPGPSSGCGSRR